MYLRTFYASEDYRKILHYTFKYIFYSLDLQILVKDS